MKYVQSPWNKLELHISLGNHDSAKIQYVGQEKNEIMIKVTYVAKKPPLWYNLKYLQFQFSNFLNKNFLSNFKQQSSKF